MPNENSIPIIKPKVAIYCRLSNEDDDKDNEDDSRSIQNQKSMLINYTLAQDWEIYAIYSDDDFKGSDRLRPEWNRLLEDAEKGKFEIILCKHQSRFTRELELVEKYINNLFIEWNIRFVSITDNADTSVKGNRKSRQINGLVNEWYLEDLSESIKSVLRNKQKEGYYIGAMPLYGYKKDPNQKGHLIIDEEAAPIVREIFDLYREGYGKVTIARMLNEKGIPNPSEYKRLKGIKHHQKPIHQNSMLWKYFNISSTLKNEMYIGNMVQGTYAKKSYKSKGASPCPKKEWVIVKNTHEAIVSLDVWEKVQDMVSARFKPYKDTWKIGLFAKKVKCMNCNCFMVSKKTKEYRRLSCGTKEYGGDCIGASISFIKLEKIILDELKIIIDKYLDESDIESNISISTNVLKQVERRELEILNFEKLLAECNKNIKSLYLDKLKGIINDNEYLEFTKEFHANQEHIKFSISLCQKELKQLEKKMESETDKNSIIQQYKDISKLNREMVDELIKVIYLGKYDKETDTTPIKIHWNF